MATDAGKIRIWNMALGYVGTRTVAAEDERCEEAVQCALYWDAARRQALRDSPYNFAQRRAWLAETALPEVYAAEWTHAYALPDGWLKVHHLVTPGAARERRAPFLLAATDQGAELLLTDAAPALAAYTADVPDTSRFDDLFAGMLARKLAAMIAVPLLKNNAGKVNELAQLYSASLPDARQANAGERKERPVVDSWLAAR
ncbi:MAG: hypothetical protein LUG19_07765 [Desulfovibrio sp.]|uniref:hypothetical protein n=1 Tax=Desulfovibrio sp. TaxID=885 RepID=UPI00258A2160|nr:hypothetical protein [Desulfovibrio sp.]MCD7984134.1 hypothetical protein [Desulfovibrio sp.]